MIESSETCVQSEKPIEGVLAELGAICTKTKGISMLPFIVSGRDTVMIIAKKERFVKGEIILFKTEQGKYILHRVVKVCDFGYITRGDNCIGYEKVQEANALGYAEGWYIRKKYIYANDPKLKKRVDFWLKDEKRRKFLSKFVTYKYFAINKLKRIAAKIFSTKNKKNKN